MDLRCWMTNLDHCIRKIPVIYLAIPAPDCEKAVRLFLKLGPLAKRVVIGWSVTQTLSVTEQLNHGIRYFDLRVAKNDKDDKFYFTHGLYCQHINGGLNELSEFLAENKKEIVILDFQHFYDFTFDDHQKLHKDIQMLFKNKICPFPNKICTVTLDWMEKSSYQVVVIYRSDAGIGQFWPSDSFPTPWPRKTETRQLLPFLDSVLARRDKCCGLVLQCVLTPDNGFVICHLCGNLRESCAKPCLHGVLPWLNHQHAGMEHENPGVNVIISDFIEQNNAIFCKNVIALNNRLSNIFVNTPD
ncbi:PI-PLC X domain-containing protein 3 isoform X2 [Lycorma delicatula]|uniref:PI-PLC X domain-containing protein 3 isoform X2 n=1 Tax=Lycorma delicatula TaxID=130591 RepID=UPI003F51592B